MFEATDLVLNTILVPSNISYKSLNSYCEQRDFDRHEIFYFLKRKNSLSCSVTYFSVSCFYGLFPRYFNLFDM